MCGGSDEGRGRPFSGQPAPGAKHAGQSRGGGAAEVWGFIHCGRITAISICFNTPKCSLISLLSLLFSDIFFSVYVSVKRMKGCESHTPLTS